MTRLVSRSRAAVPLVMDGAGVVLMLSLAGWAALSASMAGGDPEQQIALLFAAVGGMVVARATARAAPLLAPTVAVAVCLFLLVAGAGGRRGAISPLGYANADAALYLQAGAATMLLLLLVRSTAGRYACIAVSLALAALMLETRSLAGISLMLLLWTAFAASSRSPRAVVAAAGFAVALAVATTAWLGAAYARNGSQRVTETAARSLSESRLELWADAVAVMGEHPLSGVGPGRFERASPAARADADLRWAHNGFLQHGAETGLVGLALMLGAFAWAFLRLGSGDPGRAEATGAAAVSVLGVQASVDYILHFPAVPLLCAALVGSALGARAAGWS